MPTPMTREVRSAYPRYRVRPRSAVAVMTADADATTGFVTTGFVERFRQLTRQVFSDAA